MRPAFGYPRRRAGHRSHTFPEENAMSNSAHPYEPLTSENAALVLVDHQVGLMSGVRDYSIAELKHNVIGLAKRDRSDRPQEADFCGSFA
jgi:hypothetical protein